MVHHHVNPGKGQLPEAIFRHTNEIVPQLGQCSNKVSLCKLSNHGTCSPNVSASVGFPGWGSEGHCSRWPKLVSTDKLLTKIIKHSSVYVIAAIRFPTY